MFIFMCIIYIIRFVIRESYLCLNLFLKEEKDKEFGIVKERGLDK